MKSSAAVNTPNSGWASRTRRTVLFCVFCITLLVFLQLHLSVSTSVAGSHGGASGFQNLAYPSTLFEESKLGLAESTNTHSIFSLKAEPEKLSHRLLSVLCRPTDTHHEVGDPDPLHKDNEEDKPSKRSLGGFGYAIPFLSISKAVVKEQSAKKSFSLREELREERPRPPNPPQKHDVFDYEPNPIRPMVRRAFASHAEMPRVAIIPTREGPLGLERATICADRRNPLRVFLMMSENSSTYNLERNFEAQVSELLNSRPQINSDPLIREALITIVLVDNIQSRSRKASHVQVKAALIRYSTAESPLPSSIHYTKGERKGDEDMRSRRRYVTYADWLRNSTRATELLVPPTMLEIPLASKAGTVVGERTRPLEDFPSRKDLMKALWQAVIRQRRHHGRSNSNVEDQPDVPKEDLLVSQLIQSDSAPHFVFDLPPNVIFSQANLAALCYYDPVANEESEASAVYPYAPPYVYQDGKERIPLAFVYPQNGNVGGRIGGKRQAAQADGVSKKRVTLIVSCRLSVTFYDDAADDNNTMAVFGDQRSRTVANETTLRWEEESQLTLGYGKRPIPAIDVRHYSKGGDVVLRGASRMVKIKTYSIQSHSQEENLEAFVVYEGGVHPDMILYSSGSDKNSSVRTRLAVAEREAIFRMSRAPLGNRCSKDPTNPTRVGSFMPFFVDRKRLSRPHNDYGILLRALNATAQMAPSSDVIIGTNVHPSVAMGVIRSTARGVLPLEFDTRLASSPTNNNPSTLPPPPDPFTPFDYAYPSTHGEMVIISYEAANRIHINAGLLQSQVISAKGFYDFIRYSEEDVYITRDQFSLFCSTVALLEERNQYLNFLRFEYDKSMVEVLPHFGSDRTPFEPDVRLAYAPEQYCFLDEDWYILPHEWQFTGTPEAVVISLNVSQQKPSHFSYEGVQPALDGFYDEFDVVSGLPAATCRKLPYFDNSRYRPVGGLSTLERGSSRGAYSLRNTRNGHMVHPEFPTSQLTPGTYEVFARSAPHHSHSHLEPNITAHRVSLEQKNTVDSHNKAFDISGCYVIAKPLHTFFKSPRVYNAMFLVPDSRLGYYFGHQSEELEWRREREGESNIFDGIVTPRYPQWADMGAMDREYVAHFVSPLVTYEHGVVLMRPYPHRASNDAGEKPPNRTVGIGNRYLMDRLSVVAHGSHRHVKKSPAVVYFPIFELQDAGKVNLSP